MEEIIKELKSVKTKPCVTIIIPSYLNSFANKKSLVLRLKENVVTASKRITESYNSEISKIITNNLNEAISNIDLRSPAKGIGLYANQDMSKYVSLNFVPSERMIIGDHFDLSEIEQASDVLFDYGVLVLSRKETNFYKGKGNHLEKIVNDDFPAIYEHEFQIKRADKFSFYNNEESKINQSRRDAYFRKIDKALIKVCFGNPLILVGTIENLSDYKKVKKSDILILSELLGNKVKTPLSQLTEEIWDSVQVNFR